MSTLRMVALTLCGVLVMHSQLLAQVYEPPGPPPDRSPIVPWIISTLLFIAILFASMKSSKRSQTTG